MEWHEIEVNGQRSVKFPEKILPGVVSPMQTTTEQEQNNENAHAHKVGGIIKQGEWAWLAHGCTLKIHSLRNGQIISTCEFAESKGYENCSIKCVEEIFPGSVGANVYLAVCLQSNHGPNGGGSYVALYSMEHSNVLSCMEMRLHINCARFMSAQSCRRSLLQNFDGCLALGSEEGIIVLLDLNFRQILAGQELQKVEDAFVPCNIINWNLPLTEIHRHFRQCQQDGIHFGLQLEVMEMPCAIQCLLPIDLILGLAVGLEDGRLVLYDLAELQIFHESVPQGQQDMSPLTRMAYLEPTDDPRPCLYLWAMHDNEEDLSAIMHVLMYERRVAEEDGTHTFEAFQTCSLRLELPLESTKSEAVACQAIVKSSTHAELDANCLCALSWHSVLEEKNKLLLFDLNQWYKEQMPFMLSRNKSPSYLAGYVLSGQHCGLDVYVNPQTIAHFNSMQRHEEHFYPISLSFDCALLLSHNCREYNWEGAQNRVINILRASNAGIFLEPEPYFQQIIRTRLMPQFCELLPTATFSRKAKYELMLSVALEQNCYSLLRDCARSWADGSFIGNLQAATGLSLSTLTDWLWQRANQIRSRCDELCKGLFAHNGYALDQRDQKELGFVTRQLKLLADLLAEILKSGKRNMPENVYSSLETKHKSIQMAADYQSILLWLLNIGLLPEASRYHSATDKSNLVPYPYQQLKDLYTEKRNFFAKYNESFVSKKTGSCRLLYIDAYIEHNCQGSVLREFWLEHKGNGLYPPTSIKAMLRVMLVPELSFESKCAILLYFFLDLHTTIDEDKHKHIVDNFIKFPSVFKLSATLIKTVQSFWNLDHEHFLPAVDEFVSPFNNNQNYPQWLLELLIEALLTQHAANLALRILEARPTLVSPILKLKTLLANELITEAFHFARSKYDDSLLELFFTGCLCAGNYGIIRDLALSEREGELLQSILKRNKSQSAESLHFVYLLQRSKYIDAVSYMNDVSKGRSARSMDTPHMVLSAYNTTMTPVTQGLTDVYFRIRNKIKQKETDNKSPVPLSCQLIKQNANNLLGGIYHSSALSAHFASYYWGGDLESGARNKHQTLLSSQNAPFLRKPQNDTHYLDYLERNDISYPQTYRAHEKRTVAERELQSDEVERYAAQYNPKKRRRLLGDDLVKDLVQLMAHKKSDDGSFQAAMTGESVGDLTRQQNVESAERDYLAAGSSKITPRKKLATQTLHSILKTTATPEKTYSHGARTVEEEKSLRFQLPGNESARKSARSDSEDDEVGDGDWDDNEHVKVYNRNVGENETDDHLYKTVTVDKISPRRRIFNTTTSTLATYTKPDDEEETLEITVKLEPPLPETDTTHKVLTRAISVESSGSSSVHSSKAPSEEDYYSPLSSQNVSMVTPRSDKREGSLSGPQPRKPLDRVSAERQTDTKATSSPETKPIITKTIVSIASAPAHVYTSAISARRSLLSAMTPGQVSELSSIDTHKFMPITSSSKVCETQSKFVTAQEEEAQDIAERSTVVSTLTHLESTLYETAQSQLTLTEQRAALHRTGERMLDTTVEMSSRDSTMWDTSAKLVEESVEVAAEENEQRETDEEGKMQERHNITEKLKQIFSIPTAVKDSQKETAEKTEIAFASSSLHMELLTKSSENMREPLSVEMPTCNNDDNSTVDDDVIVLSSSSVSSSVPDQSEDDDDDDDSDEDVDVSDDDDDDDDIEEVEEEEDDSEDDDDDQEDEDDEEASDDTFELVQNLIANGDKKVYNAYNETNREIAEEDVEDQSDDEKEKEPRVNICRNSDEAEEVDNDDVVITETINIDDDDDNNEEEADMEAELVVSTVADAEDEDMNNTSIVVSSSHLESERCANKDSSVAVQETVNVQLENADSTVNIQEDEDPSEPTITTTTTTTTEDANESLRSDVFFDAKDSSFKSADNITVFREETVMVEELIVETINEQEREESEITKETKESLEGESFIKEEAKKTNENETEIIIEEEMKSVTPTPKSDTQIPIAVEDMNVTDVTEVEEEIHLHVDEDEINEEKTIASDRQTTEETIKKSEKVTNVEKETAAESEKSLREEIVDKKSVITVSETDSKFEQQVSIQKEEEDEGEKEEEDEGKKEKEEEGKEEENERKKAEAEEGNKEEQEERKEHYKEKEDLTVGRKRTRSISRQSEADVSNVVDGFTPKTRRKLRADSVDDVSTSTRQSRRLSQARESLQDESLTTRTRRHTRAGSVQLDETYESLTPTRKKYHLRGASMPPADADNTLHSRQARAGSMPHGKPMPRTRSNALDKIAEDDVFLDSPATRTRLRSRLTSHDSDLDSPLTLSGSPRVQRRSSMSSSVSELAAAHTPRRTRRNSIISNQTESTTDNVTPHNLRPRKEGKEEHDTPKRTASKRKQSVDERSDVSVSPVSTVSGELKKTKSSPDSAAEALDYSSARRLTRTQLAVMERSAALAAASSSSRTSTSPSTPKAIARRRISRATTVTPNPDSDVESIASHRSSYVHSPTTRHMYATRSSTKDKDEIDDDMQSVASSMGSEQRQSKRRSKDSKSSPNTTLTVIPEEQTEVAVPPKKRGRSLKKTTSM